MVTTVIVSSHLAQYTTGHLSGYTLSLRSQMIVLGMDTHNIDFQNHNEFQETNKYFITCTGSGVKPSNVSKAQRVNLSFKVL